MQILYVYAAVVIAVVCAVIFALLFFTSLVCWGFIVIANFRAFYMSSTTVAIANGDDDPYA